MKQKTEYVVGLLFRGEGLEREVALVTKARPEWQRSKLNGVGGKIEPGEMPWQAMRREWKEETGTDVKAWRMFATLKWRTAVVHFFEARVTNEFPPFACPADEPVNWFNIQVLMSATVLPVIPNLKWLIPLALDKDGVVVTADDPS